MIFFTASQCILVTGASSGIGRAVALRCNELGATVIAHGRDCGTLLESREMSGDPSRFHTEQRDLAEDMDSLPVWVKGLREKYGKLHGLVPCAGFARLMPLRAYSRKEAQELLDIHFHVPLLLAKGFADRRNNAGTGASIVFMASAAAIAREAGLIAYGGAKAALAAAAGILSRELARQGIRVNTLAPGVVKTPMGEEYLSFLSEEAREQETAAYPLGLGEPGDVANMAAFLLSDAGKRITGQTVVIAGGRY
ncbi:MAG: SDR family oxidoreductase [Desulfovibrio sp.]|nr:SDR family oxidoreductase [Desulfovibrio sp.]